MEAEVHRDVLLLPRWVPAWGHGFGDLVALICMNLNCFWRKQVVEPGAP